MDTFHFERKKPRFGLAQSKLFIQKIFPFRQNLRATYKQTNVVEELRLLFRSKQLPRP